MDPSFLFFYERKERKLVEPFLGRLRNFEQADSRGVDRLRQRKPAVFLVRRNCGDPDLSEIHCAIR